MDCPNCGQTAIEGDSTCWQCGHRLSAAGESQVLTRPGAVTGRPAESAKPRGTLPMTAVRKRGSGRAGERSFLDRIRAVLTLDISVFDEISRSRPWMQIGVLMVFGLILSSLLNLSYVILRPTPELQQFSSDILAVSVLISVGGGFALSLFLTPLMILISSLILHLPIRVFGGRGTWKDTTAVWGYFQAWTPVNVLLGGAFMLAGFASIGTLVNFLIGLVMLAELILAVELVHGISRVRAALSVLIPVAVVIVVVLVLFIILGALAMSVIMAGPGMAGGL
ncbi:MAG: hypothetical protein GF416_03705 [Candidatus Altiarchaeales archaeon]|nr:hypothetical protein [Candidatus Altiarchaeales archaeon]MBD3416225.1 hypothetical protein [Candidatus Altiarchaeales archaeon]